MKTLLLALMLAAPAPDTAEAELLYREGTALYDAADYQGAVDKFTAALAELDSDVDPHTKLLLLFNIAVAHEKQFSIDRDATHLRQALTLYKHYREYARKHGDLGDELDVEARVATIERKLRTHDQIERNRDQPKTREGPVPPPPQVVDVDKTDWKKPRNTGIGLVVAGSAMTIGGAVLAIVGTRLEPRAQAQVDSLADMGVPADHPAWAEGEDFVAQQRRQGNAMLGAGVAVTVVGLVGVGVGSYYLVKAKKMKEHGVSLAPTFGAGTAGLQIGGRF